MGLTWTDVAPRIRPVTDADPAAGAMRDNASIATTYLAELADRARTVDVDVIAAVAHEVVAAISTGRGVFLAGNGGSAAAATHMACDWVSACLDTGLRGAQIIALSDNLSSVTATANDFGYVELFARQVEFMGKPGDLLVLLSVSGDSANVVRAAEVARARGLLVVGLFGNAGAAARLCEIWTDFGDGDYGITEDLHLAVNHIIVRIIHGGEPRRYPGAGSDRAAASGRT